MLDLKNQTPMNDEQIKKSAPSIFTENPASNVSQHYTHIPTSQVINDMRNLGWNVVDVKEVKARRNVGYQKHLVVFRNPEIVINGNDGDTVYPQILLTNSYDGKSSFTFTAGLFRLVCENGLVISTETFSDIKLRHMGYSFGELKEKIYSIINELPGVVDTMNKMKQIKLNEDQILDFAKKVVEIRFDEPNVKIDLEEIVKPLRKEDNDPNLWSVFNILQEKIINGGFNYIGSTKKSRKTRKIKNFNQDIKINKELFNLTLEYIG
jgi:hypothetical protein